MSSPVYENKPGTDQLAKQIDWLLAHPGVSDWLKTALQSAEGCDPVMLMNDLELLRLVLSHRADKQIGR